MTTRVAAAAQFAAEDLKVKKCFIVNDNETYGLVWPRRSPMRPRRPASRSSATSRGTRRRPTTPRCSRRPRPAAPTAIYIGGIYDNNGGQLVKDKFRVLGDNEKVKLLGPDGFTGYPDLDKQPESQGMYMTFAGLSTEQLREAGVPVRSSSTPTRPSTAPTRRPTTRCTAWPRCRSSSRRSPSPTAPARAVTDAVFSGEASRSC
jgi:hypothetical protein